MAAGTGGDSNNAGDGVGDLEDGVRGICHRGSLAPRSGSHDAIIA